MATQTILVEPAQKYDPYPDAPPRDDMQNLIYLEKRSIVEALTYHFGNPDTTLIGEIRLGPSLSVPKDTRVPDLMVAFNCDVAQAREDNGYRPGKPATSAAVCVGGSLEIHGNCGLHRKAF